MCSHPPLLTLHSLISTQILGPATGGRLALVDPGIVSDGTVSDGTVSDGTVSVGGPVTLLNSYPLLQAQL